MKPVEPSVSLVFGSSRGTEELLESTDIFFECNVHSNPLVSSVQWMFNGKLLVDSKSNQVDQQLDGKQSTIGPNSTDQSNLSNNLSDQIHYSNLQTTPKAFGRLDRSEMNSTKDESFVDDDDKNVKKSLDKHSHNRIHDRRKRKTESDQIMNESTVQLPNILISSRSLLIKGASKAHSGSYQCFASNTIGTGQSDIIPLHVHFAPRCSDNQPLQYVLKSSQTASIHCEVDADPTEGILFHWLLLSGSGELTSEAVLNTAYEHYQSKQSTVAPFTSFYHHFQPHAHGGSSGLANGRNLSSPNIQFMIEHMTMNNGSDSLNASTSVWQPGQPQSSTSSKPIRVRSLAKYTPTHNSHYGVLQCWAANTAGVQRQPCTFFVLAAQAPEPPINCTATNVTISTLTVECTPGYSGGLPATYHLEVYTKETEFPLFKQQQYGRTNLSDKRKGTKSTEPNGMNEILIEESNSILTNVTTVSPTPLPTKVLINGKSMLLLHNLTAEEYPFFSVNTLPPGKLMCALFQTVNLTFAQSFVFSFVFFCLLQNCTQVIRFI